MAPESRILCTADTAVTGMQQIEAPPGPKPPDRAEQGQHNPLIPLLRTDQGAARRRQGWQFLSRAPERKRCSRHPCILGARAYSWKLSGSESERMPDTAQRRQQRLQMTNNRRRS